MQGMTLSQLRTERQRLLAVSSPVARDSPRSREPGGQQPQAASPVDVDKIAASMSKLSPSQALDSLRHVRNESRWQILEKLPERLRSGVISGFSDKERGEAMSALGSKKWNRMFDDMRRIESKSPAKARHASARSATPENATMKERGRSPTPRNGFVSAKNGIISGKDIRKNRSMSADRSSGGGSPVPRSIKEPLRGRAPTRSESPPPGMFGSWFSSSRDHGDDVDDSPRVNSSREKKGVSFDASVWRAEAKVTESHVHRSPRRSRERGVVSKQDLKASKVEDLLALQQKFTNRLQTMQKGSRERGVEKSPDGRKSPIKSVLRKEPSDLLAPEDQVGATWETPSPPVVTPRNKQAAELIAAEAEALRKRLERERIEEQLEELKGKLGEKKKAAGGEAESAAPKGGGLFSSLFRRSPPKETASEPPPFDFTDDEALASQSPASSPPVSKEALDSKEFEKQQIQKQLAMLQGELGRISSARKAIAASPDLNGYGAGAAGAKQTVGDTSEGSPSKGGGFLSSLLGSSGGKKSSGGRDRGSGDAGGIIVGGAQRSPQAPPRNGKVVIGADPEEQKANLKINKWLFSNQGGAGDPREREQERAMKHDDSIEQVMSIEEQQMGDKAEKALLTAHHHFSDVVRVFQSLRSDAASMGEPIDPAVADEAAILTKETRELLQRLHNAMAAQAKSLRIPLNNPNAHGSPTRAAARGGGSSSQTGRPGRHSDGNDSPSMALLSPMFSKSSEDILAGNADRVTPAKGPKQRF